MSTKLKSYFAISLLLLFAISQCVSPIRANNLPVTEEKIYSNTSGLIMRVDSIISNIA